MRSCIVQYESLVFPIAPLLPPGPCKSKTRPPKPKPEGQKIYKAKKVQQRGCLDGRFKSWCQVHPNQIKVGSKGMNDLVLIALGLRCADLCRWPPEASNKQQQHKQVNKAQRSLIISSARKRDLQIPAYPLLLHETYHSFLRVEARVLMLRIQALPSPFSLRLRELQLSAGADSLQSLHSEPAPS